MARHVTRGKKSPIVRPMKERQRGKETIVFLDKACLRHLEDVGNEISVGKRNALG
jgi:hypothetical protein